MGNFNEGKQFQMQLLLQSRRQYLPPPHNSTGCHKSMGIRIGDAGKEQKQQSESGGVVINTTAETLDI